MNDAIYESNCLNDTQEIGIKIAAQLPKPSCVYLRGEMGAGKTTLTKSIIQAMGFVGEVTSPTYNLVQEYKVNQAMVYHMDLYRLENPAELEFLAIEDLWSEHSIFLIEWADKGGNYLQKATHEITINKGDQRLDLARHIVLREA